MIRRILWLLIILGIAYWIYKAVNPEWAQELVVRIQSYFSSDKKNNDMTLVDTWDSEEQTGATQKEYPLVYTWELATGWLVELEYILSNQPNTQSGENVQEEEQLVITEKQTTPTVKSQTTTSSTKKWLSNQDMNDTKALLQAIVE